MLGSSSRRFILIAAVAAVSTIAFAGSAAAQVDPICSQYEESSGQIESNVNDERCQEDTSEFAGSAGSDPGGLSGEVGSLPFTGLDLIGLGAVALVLVGTGFVIRRMAGPRST